MARYRTLFALYRRLYRRGEALARRFTPAGRAALAALVVLAALGIDTAQSMAFQLFALLGAALAVAWLASLRRPPAIALTRELPPFATVGEPFGYTLQLHNTSGTTLRGLRLRDGLEALEPDSAALQAALLRRRREPWTARLSGLRFYARVLHQVRGALGTTVELPPLAPGERLQLRMSLTPLRRGALEFTHAELIWPDPLGLAQALRRIELGSQSIVLPARHAVRRLDLAGPRRFQRGGVTLASSVGDSAEFLGLRPYRPGDALRSIHWKSWARSGRPVVKEFQDEFFVRHGLVLDTFAAPADDDLFEAALSAACSLACAERSADALLDLLLVENRLYRFTVGRGVGTTGQLLHILAGVQRCAEERFELLARACLAQSAALSGVFLLLLAWDAPRRALVEELLRRRLRLRVLLLCREAPVLVDDALAAHLRPLRLGRLAQDLAAL